MTRGGAPLSLHAGSTRQSVVFVSNNGWHAAGLWGGLLELSTHSAYNLLNTPGQCSGSSCGAVLQRVVSNACQGLAVI